MFNEDPLMSDAPYAQNHMLYFSYLAGDRFQRPTVYTTSARSMSEPDSLAVRATAMIG